MYKTLFSIALVFALGWSANAQSGTFKQISDIQIGPESSSPLQFRVIGNRLLFSAEKEQGKGGLFSYDSQEVTELLSFDIGISLGSSVYYFNDGLAEINGKRLFMLETFTSEILMVTDGTKEGTHQLKDISNGQLFNVSNFFYLNGKLYFLEDGDDVTLWETDGTTIGTSEVKVFCNNEPSECYVQSSLAAFQKGGKAFFFLSTSETGRELWVTDGTSSGTSVIDILPGPPTGSWLPFVDGAFIDNDFYFGVDDGIHGYELYKSNGTLAGTSLVKDINQTIGNSYHNKNSRPYQFYAFDNKILFSADDGILGEEVWVTDGTSLGTKLLKETQPGITERGDINNYTQFNGQLLFQASKNNTINSYDIWKTNGTPQGTVLLKSMSYNFDAFLPKIEFKNELYFLAKNLPGGMQLWKTDGTSDNTIPVATLSIINNLSVSSSAPFVAIDDNFYFIADNGTGGALWRSGGEEENTQAISLSNIEIPGEVDVNNLRLLNGKLYFSANFNDKGFELWEYTPAKSTLVHDKSVKIREILCHPNPSKYEVFFENNDLKIYEVVVYDMTGKQIDLPIIHQSILVKSLQSGIYQLVFKSKGVPVGASKIVVQK